MNRAFKTEYYPDMVKDNYGKKVVTLSCAVNNGKRFRSLSKDERETLAKYITNFQKQLEGFKTEILNNEYKPTK